MQLGTSKEAIRLAEKELSVIFPHQLKEVWLVSNGLELFGEWRLYPVFDRSNPRKTANHIVYENTTARWEYMPTDLVSIADNGTGDHLVLQSTGRELGATIFFWDHETNRVHEWAKTLDDVMSAARSRSAKISRYQKL